MTPFSIACKSYPLKSAFTISRGSKLSADVIEISLSINLTPTITRLFKGEGLPYPRYGESQNSMMDLFTSLQKKGLTDSLSRVDLLKLLPPSSLRNALDFVLWQRDAFLEKQSVSSYLGITAPKAIPICATITIDTPERMAKEALKHKGATLFKIKLEREGVFDTIMAIAEKVPSTPLLLDANEAWDIAFLNEVVDFVTEKNLKIEMIEQPLPAGQDEHLKDYKGGISLLADESCHDTSRLDSVLPYYDVFNIKLDKTGGLTEAFSVYDYLKKHNKKIMVGCMVSSSLSILPAYFLAQQADYADLDGAAFLQNDPYDYVVYENGSLFLNKMIKDH
ncbi:MAG: dipeptide epimerase [Alphaproteobacteria bacterium]|jgi:L-alanine-DL-glutamate epimerase-like enolase superfamily enzyme|nr:dipeptide epimerase [Alphaproteobacteria bacterium]